MSIYDTTRQMAMPLIDLAIELRTAVTTDLIREKVTLCATIIKGENPDDRLDVERLVRALEAEYNVHVGAWNSLVDDTNHVPWLDGHIAAKQDWKFWDRYSRFLKGAHGLPIPAVRRLDEITDDVLGRLEDPKREGPWDRRGLVAGQVQSGKTANYIGLIAKAIDTGYKLIVVLAGIHNSLRSQTQARIDEGILGFDTRSSRRWDQVHESSLIGVGKRGAAVLDVVSFTSSDQNGDFKLNIAKQMAIAPGGATPIVLVVKKNKSILTNLFKWATRLKKEEDLTTGELRVRGVPVLMIDDEADHASVNTKVQADDPESDPSVINGLIRQFLNTFDRTAYVAYTATPFANIFIDPDASHQGSGEDLFPRSFIVNLPTPSTYTGPERVFGLREDVENAIDEVGALPITRPITDYEAWLPDKHKSGDNVGGELPESLRDAIVFFLMAGAVRRLRGQGSKHHSMLVHVTRFTNLQKQVKDQVQEFLREVTQRLAYGEGSETRLRLRVERLYTDLIQTTEDMHLAQDLEGLIGPVPALDEMWRDMHAAAVKTHVHLINGNSADALEYVDHADGTSVIAIGGDKLSRGLTLEGLSVSYYLRASRMYDTLMQMGRWFGYRPGYLDVCRLFTTKTLISWYERITAAAAELQSEFDAMAAVGRTPEDFGLRVRQHPDGLLVTSPTKLKAAQKISISFSGSISETVTFRGADRQRNLSALSDLVSGLRREERARKGMILFRHVNPSRVMTFFEHYHADRAAYKAQPKALLDYIAARVADDELTNWTVMLASVDGRATWPVDGVDVGLTERTSHNSTPQSDRYTIRRVVSTSHQLLELPRGSAAWDEALRGTIGSWENNTSRTRSSKRPEEPSGLWERRVRDNRVGLLLLYMLDPAQWREDERGKTPFVGFAASFPVSGRAQPKAYQVNAVTLREFGWDDDDED